MDDFSRSFEDRLMEVEAYLDLLDSLDQQVRDGLRRFDLLARVITAQQQRILYSSVYLQLYNLVEATIYLCISSLIKAMADRQPLPGELSNELLSEWVRSTAQTHKNLNTENRLQRTLELCEYLVNERPVADFEFDRGGGGNWDDRAIESIARRLGLSLRVSREIKSAVKRPFRNDQGALLFIKNLRNKLAHGNISFSESGEGITVRELRDLKERTSRYLREVVDSFKSFIDGQEFLAAQYRPGGAGA